MKSKVKSHCDKAKIYYTNSLQHMRNVNEKLANYITKLEGRE